MEANQKKDLRDVILDQTEGGLLLLLDAVKAGDPSDEIVWRIQEELRLIRRRSLRQEPSDAATDEATSHRPKAFEGAGRLKGRLGTDDR